MVGADNRNYAELNQLIQKNSLINDAMNFYMTYFQITGSKYTFVQKEMKII
jgi:hypothetical protein